jgi:hypothetical protein
MALHEVDIFNRALSRTGDARIVLESKQTAASATAANPVVVTVTAHGYVTGDLVLLRAMDEMTEVNGRVFQITKVDANSFQLDEEDGSGYTAESTGGTAQKLPTIKKSKSCFDAWTNIRDEVLEAHPWKGCTRRSRAARLETAADIIAATAVNPVVLTTLLAHGYSLGDEILVENVGGMTELNDRWFTVGAVPSTVGLQLAGEDGTTHAAYTVGGTTKKAGTPFTPDSGYDNRYTLPSDCLRVVELIDEDYLWIVENQELHTDEGPTAAIRFIFRQRDVTKYRPVLESVLAHRLSLEIVEELTQSNTKRERAFEEYESFLNRARATDSMEQSPMPLQEDDWILARQ